MADIGNTTPVSSLSVMQRSNSLLKYFLNRSMSRAGWRMCAGAPGAAELDNVRNEPTLPLVFMFISQR